MKNTILISALFFIHFVSYAQQGYVVRGQVEGLPDGPLNIMKSFNGKVLNETTCRNGSFVFFHEGKFTGDHCFIVIPGNQQFRIELFLEPGQINVKGKISEFKDIVVSGTPSNDANIEYKREIEKMEAYNNKLKEKLEQEKDHAKAAKIKAEIDAYYPERFYPYRKAFAHKYPNTIMAPMFLSAGIGGLQYQDICDMLAGFASDAPENWYTNRLKDRRDILEHTQIGAVLPDFTLKDPDGKKISLSDLRGSYVYVDVWASWCGPCRVENKNLVKAYEKYHKNGFTVLGISIDEDKDKWVAAIKADSLPWTNHVSSLVGWECPVARLMGCAFGMSGVPYTIMIDPEGCVIGHNLRGKDLNDKLKEVFGF